MTLRIKVNIFTWVKRGNMNLASLSLLHTDLVDVCMYDWQLIFCWMSIHTATRTGTYLHIPIMYVCCMYKPLTIEFHKENRELQFTGEVNVWRKSTFTRTVYLLGISQAWSMYICMYASKICRYFLSYMACSCKKERGGNSPGNLFCLSSPPQPSHSHGRRGEGNNPWGGASSRTREREREKKAH